MNRRCAMLVGVLALLHPLSCREARVRERVQVLDLVAWRDPDPDRERLLVVARLLNPGEATGLVGARVEGGRAKLLAHAYVDERPTTRVLSELVLPPKLEVRLRPDGVFIEVTELEPVPDRGDSVELVLLFRDRSELVVDVPVRVPKTRAGEEPARSTGSRGPGGGGGQTEGARPKTAR